MLVRVHRRTTWVVNGLVTAALVIAVLGNTSVASAAGSRAMPKKVADKLISRGSQENWPAVCKLGTPSSVRRIKKESGTTCPKAFAGLAELWTKVMPPPKATNPVVKVRGSKATATYNWTREGFAAAVVVRLQKIHGKWLVDLYRLQSPA